MSVSDNENACAFARMVIESHSDKLWDDQSRDTMSSVGTTFSDAEECSWDNVAACRTSDFMGLEENDPLGPFVHEEVKEAMLLPLPNKTTQTIWSNSQETIMEGMLFKKGRAQIHALQPRNWKHRYFKLNSNGELSYYKNHHKKGSVSLTGKNVRLCAGTSFRTCIEPKTGNSSSTEWRFSINTDNQEIVLAARTKNEMRKWISVLRALCEARSTSVQLIMNLEIEVNPKSMADMAMASPRTRAASLAAPRRRAKSQAPAAPPQNIEQNSHHYDTFSPKMQSEVPCFNFDDVQESTSPARLRSKTVQHEVFTKTKDWNERDGVLRVIKINDVPATTYQPKYTMKVRVKI